MSTAASSPAETHERTIKADSLAWGILLALFVTVFQKAIGFGRTVAFCKLLPDEQLGQWSMAYSFLIFAAPFAVFGLPGCFGRYVEQFRKENTLPQFLRVTGIVSLISTIAWFFVFICFRDHVSLAVFGSDSGLNQMLMLGIVFLATVWFNFFIELVGSLRQIKLAAWMQFISATVFSVVSVVLIFVLGPTVKSVLLGYTTGFAIATAIGIGFVVRHRKSLFSATEQPIKGEQNSIWKKVATYAVWLWIIDGLTNLFSYIDLYMVLHWNTATGEVAQSEVGQYHSGYVLPLLLGAITGIVFRALLPNMSIAWEENRKADAGRLLNSTIKVSAFGFTLFGILVTMCSPLLYDFVLDGKYASGASIMPYATMSISWISLAMLAQSYHWCAEKGHLTAASFGIGIIINFCLNAVMIPRYGLWGAVVATSIANATLMIMVLLLAKRIGWKLHAATIPVTALPMIILLPTHFAIACLVGFVILTVKTEWFLDANEKDEVVNMARKVSERVGVSF